MANKLLTKTIAVFKNIKNVYIVLFLNYHTKTDFKIINRKHYEY